jgi:phospholipid-binding lipoprotein MlaA
MGSIMPKFGRQGGRQGPLLAAALALAACAAPPPPSEPFDPDEANNRQVHAFNKSLDRGAVGPAANTYGRIIPEPVRIGVGNFASNLELPGEVVNSVLQGRIGPAAENTLRFAINTTIGLGGVWDPARKMGIEGRRTDFGETLHVWGAEEGAYVELPLLGPSTTRDTVGKVVDVFLDPLRLVLPTAEANAATVVGGFSTLGDRYRFGDTVDSILYESADSYAQARLLYLQNRRFELGQTPAEDEFFDPYEDIAK